MISSNSVGSCPAPCHVDPLANGGDDSVTACRRPAAGSEAGPRSGCARRGFPRASDSWEDRAVDERAVHTTEPHPAPLVIENERLQRALRARLAEEEALRRVATLVAQAHEPGAVLTRVTEEVGRHLQAHTTATVRFDPDGWGTIVAIWTAPLYEPYFRTSRRLRRLVVSARPR